jgi:hypothetical protein
MYGWSQSKKQGQKGNRDLQILLTFLPVSEEVLVWEDTMNAGIYRKFVLAMSKA